MISQRCMRCRAYPLGWCEYDFATDTVYPMDESICREQEDRGMTINERMKEERLRLKWSQKELASKMGCTHQLISMIENGECEPTISRLKKFCEVVGIRIGSLLETEDNLPHEMTINEYQALAMRTAEEKGRTWGNVGLGIAGEAGEVADIVKKHLYQGHPLDHDKLLEEVGDVAWYLALAATVAGVTMESVLMGNIVKLLGRYPDGFEPEKSINRKG